MRFSLFLVPLITLLIRNAVSQENPTVPPFVSKVIEKIEAAQSEVNEEQELGK